MAHVVVAIAVFAFAQEPAAAQDLRKAGSAELSTFIASELTIGAEHADRAVQATTNQLHVRAEYAVPEAREWGIFINIPFLAVDSGSGARRGGLGDVSFGVEHAFGEWKGLTIGGSFEFGLQTASDPLVGGTATTIRPAVAAAKELSETLLATAELAWRRSLHEDVGRDDINQVEFSLMAAWKVPCEFMPRWYTVGRLRTAYDWEPARGVATLELSLVKIAGDASNLRLAPFYEVALTERTVDVLFAWRVGLDLTFYF